MVSLQHPIYGVMQANAIAEIDPGPPILTAHESAYSLGLSHPRPAEQELEHISAAERRPAGNFWDDNCTDDTTGDSHLGKNDLEGGITLEHPGYSCPFALGFPGAIHMEKAHGTWKMDLRKHLTTDHRYGQSAALYEGPDNDGTRDQERRQPSPDILPSPVGLLRPIRRLARRTRVEHGGNNLHRTSRPVEVLRRSYDGVVINSGHRGDLATACTSRAGESNCERRGGRCDCPQGQSKRMKQFRYVPKCSKGPALYELGDTLERDSPRMSHLTFVKGQHANLRSDLGSTGQPNANISLEASAGASGPKPSPEDRWNNVPCCDNVNKTVTSGEARIAEAEESFNVKGKVAMESSSDKSMIGRSERVVNKLVDAENSARIRPQIQLGQSSREMASLPTRTSTTSSRTLSIREQRSMDSSYSTRFKVLEAKRCVGLPAFTSWATGPQTNSIGGATEVSMRDAFMWMIAYNLTYTIYDAQTGLDTMAHHTNFASYNMTLDDIDQSEIEQMMRQIEWEQTMSQATIADPEYETTTFDPTLSPLSGYASPSSMTTGSTNPSPLVPLLDFDNYDMTYPMVPSPDDPESLFPELMDYATNMDPAWVGSQPEGFTSPLLTSYDDQAKVPSSYPLDSQLYMTAAPAQTTYINNTSPTTYLPTLSSATAVQAPAPTPSSSQPSTTLQTPASTTTTDDLTCPHCGSTFADKTKLKVHTNKHTKPFQCTAPGCTYAAAEKKSLHRHMQGKSDYDVEHRAAARRARVPLVKHRCPREGEGCTYATFRDDNLKRHGKTCTGR